MSWRVAEVAEHAGDRRAGGVRRAAAPVQPELQRRRLRGVVGLREVDAVGLEDARPAPLSRRDRLGRAELRLVVAGAGRPALGGAGRAARRRRARVKNGVDRAGVQRERLLLVELLADRLGGAEGDVGDVGGRRRAFGGAATAMPLDAGSSRDARLDRRCRSRRALRRAAGERRLAARRAGRRAGRVSPASSSGVLGLRRRQAAAERDVALRASPGLGVEQDERARSGRPRVIVVVRASSQRSSSRRRRRGPRGGRRRRRGSRSP